MPLYILFPVMEQHTEQLYAVTRPLMALFIISPFVVVGFLVSFFFLFYILTDILIYRVRYFPK